jgi:hypothetical protein
MSVMYRKRTISAWQREEDGSYKAEIDGYHLHVKWRPESSDARRGYTWTAEGPEEKKFEADEVVEEIEEAMGNAEYALRIRLHPELV